MKTLRNGSPRAPLEGIERDTSGTRRLKVVAGVLVEHWSASLRRREAVPLVDPS